MNRKQFLKTAGIGTASLLAAPMIAEQISLKMKSKHDYSQAFGLARSLREEHSYHPLVEGKIPAEIRGTLYRNGPGLFERDGYRKANILDGDGMVQAFRFAKGAVHYRNRFVRTHKWLDEEAADKYLYNTWTTRRPGGMLKNAFFQGKFKGQAGVTVRVLNGKLYAFDESSLPYRLDPETLETLNGEVDFGVHFENARTLFAAHNKVDGQTGEWVQFGLENGPKASIQLSIFDASGQLKRQRRYELSLGTYMHDFFVSENYIVFNLQPAVMNPLSFVLGMDSYVDSLRWKHKQGSTFLVVHKSLQGEPLCLGTEATWMWHSVNAFERGGEIFCYFCGYDEPDHFLGDHAQTFAIMRPNADPADAGIAISAGSIRLVRIDPKKGKIRQEILNHDLDRTYEFPVINEQFTSHPNSYCYLASGDRMGAFHHAINRVHLESGKTETYDFGEGLYCGEPIFVPRPGHRYSSSLVQEPGWLMTLAFDRAADKSFLAILNAEALADGPVAKIHLVHHSPMSFHGTWHGA